MHTLIGVRRVYAVHGPGEGTALPYHEILSANATAVLSWIVPLGSTGPDLPLRLADGKHPLLLRLADGKHAGCSKPGEVAAAAAATVLHPK